MRKICWLILAIFLFSCGSGNGGTYEEPNVELPAVGVSAFAAAHNEFGYGSENCTQLLRFLDAQNEPFLAFVWRTFGTNYSCINSYLARNSHKKHWLEIHVSNEVCRRNFNCYSQELLPGMPADVLNAKIGANDKAVLSAYANRMKEVASFCASFGNNNTGCLLSLGLESQYDERAAKTLAKLAQQNGWLDSELVHNPVGGDLYKGDAGAYYLEFHGLQLDTGQRPREKTIVSLDGSESDLCGINRQSNNNQFSRNQLLEWLHVNTSSADKIALWCGMWQGLNGQPSRFAKNPMERNPGFSSEVVDKFLNILQEIF